MAYGIEREGGFSLLELIVVMAIMGIILSVAVPSLVSTRRLMKLKGAAQSVSSTFYSARMQAVKTAADCDIVFDLAGRSFESATGNTCSIATTALPDGIEFGWGGGVTKNVWGGPAPTDSITFGSDTASFQALGTVNTGTIYLKNSLGDTMAVSISSGGRIKTRRWNGSQFE